MKSLLCFFALLLASLVSAISSTGDRLLAIFDDVEEKGSYSKFLGDLESQFSHFACILWNPRLTN